MLTAELCTKKPIPLHSGIGLITKSLEKPIALD